MILDILTEDLVEIGITAKSKNDLLGKMLDIACRSDKVNDKKLALKDVIERENMCSTGMEHGIAIPHAKTDAVKELIACVGITHKPIPFESIDGKPVQIFLMTLSPKGQSGPHIRFLAEIARLLKDDTKRDLILKAKDSKELIEVIKG